MNLLQESETTHEYWDHYINVWGRDLFSSLLPPAKVVR